ncbi:MAG: hypothetical protein QOG85_1490 [Gaiellaceae bacterium]|jgi:hypothetical protein|nr:hypothetical protein [Gaiellaceae bacterium]
MDEQKEPLEGWVILELMGHRRLGGYLREQEIAGQGFLRIDVPSRDGDAMVASQLYSPSAVYCITPTTEALAKAVAKATQPEPVHRWELPAPADKPGERENCGYCGERHGADEPCQEDRA